MEGKKAFLKSVAKGVNSENLKVVYYPADFPIMVRPASLDSHFGLTPQDDEILFLNKDILFDKHPSLDWEREWVFYKGCHSNPWVINLLSNEFGHRFFDRQTRLINNEMQVRVLSDVHDFVSNMIFGGNVLSESFDDSQKSKFLNVVMDITALLLTQEYESYPNEEDYTILVEIGNTIASTTFELLTMVSFFSSGINWSSDEEIYKQFCVWREEFGCKSLFKFERGVK